MTRCSGSRTNDSSIRVEPGRLVGGEEVLVERPAEEGAVDAEEHVGLRVALRQDRLVDDGAGIAALDGLDRDPGVVGEGGQHLLGHHEAVVGQQPDRDRLAGSGRRSGALGLLVVATGRCEHRYSDKSQTGELMSTALSVGGHWFLRG